MKPALALAGLAVAGSLVVDYAGGPDTAAVWLQVAAGLVAGPPVLIRLFRPRPAAALEAPPAVAQLEQAGPVLVGVVVVDQAPALEAPPARRALPAQRGRRPAPYPRDRSPASALPR